jgi:hypothetical protein
MIEGSGAGSGSIPPTLIDPDPDPVGPKTCRSGGSGSGFGSGSATLPVVLADGRLLSLCQSALSALLPNLSEASRHKILNIISQIKLKVTFKRNKSFKIF